MVHAMRTQQIKCGAVSTSWKATKILTVSTYHALIAQPVFVIWLLRGQWLMEGWTDDSHTETNERAEKEKS
jgi:hypothetical protein